MLSSSNPANEVTMHLSIADCRLLVACIYTAQTVDTLEAARAFFGDDALTLALLAMYARQTAATPIA